MTTSYYTIPDPERAKAYEEAATRLREIGDILYAYRADPRVRICLANFEGLGEGWFHGSVDDPEYLVDLLDDLRLEALGTPLEDHWAGHAMTVEEAGGWMGD